jgi:putative two-component system response regulator
MINYTQFESRTNIVPALLDIEGTRRVMSDALQHVTPPHVRARVLVVDDERSMRDLLGCVLAKAGYETESVASGGAALEAVEAAPPDLILLDVHMPGVDGFDVCRRLKQSDATRLIPVVLVTGRGDREHRIRGINAGADDFIAKPFDMVELTARVRSLVRLKRYTDRLDSADAIISSLALTIEARDPYTEGHCDRLSQYAVAMGLHLNLGPDDIDALQRGGYFHDIGKIGIPDALLLKPERLSPAEFELIKQHTIIGERLCGGLRSLRQVRQIVRHHHERLNGSGYPDGLSGDAIPLVAQIVGIADAYDAMTTDRPYRRARKIAEAHAELRADVERGLFRPDLVQAFIALSNTGAFA